MTPTREEAERMATALIRQNAGDVADMLRALLAERDAALAECERLRLGGCARGQTTTQWCAEAVQMMTERDAARAEAAQAVICGEAVAQVWRPIATAPTGDAGTRDAPDVLVYAAPAHGLRGFMAVTRWHHDGGWCVDELRPVTHWMPLPEPPHAK